MPRRNPPGSLQWSGAAYLTTKVHKKKITPQGGGSFLPISHLKQAIMAAKQGTDFNHIMSDLKAGRFSPIYILMGDEAYYIDKIADYLAENVLKPEEVDFNRTICFGSDTTASQVVDIARRYPMMAERQLVVVKEAQSIKQLDALEKYLAHPTPTTVLVWCVKNGNIDGRKYKKLLTLANSVGVVFESKKLYDRQLPVFIKNYLKERHVNIEEKACMMMAENIGSDLNRLVSEMDKVIISLKNDNKTITDEIVEREIGVSKDFNGFELRDALVRKDVLKANRIIKYFDSNPKAGDIYSLLPLVFNYFQNLMILHYSSGARSEQGIAEALGLRSTWAAKDYPIGLRNYSPRKVMDIIGKIRETDSKGKGIENHNTEAGELMKELIFFILH